MKRIKFSKRQRREIDRLLAAGVSLRFSFPRRTK